VVEWLDALVLGERLGYGTEPMQPHNVTMTVLGTALLWFGWFGFNAGSGPPSAGKSRQFNYF
jgi:Amt family ammonium transporter